MKQSLVPIAELPSSAEVEDFVDSPIIWDVQPGQYVDQERICLDTVRTARLLKVAGFCGVHVRQYTAESGRQDNDIVGIGSVGFDGTATAIAARTAHKQSLSKSSFMYCREDQGLVLECQRPGLRVHIDRTESGSRVSDYVRSGMNRETAWSKVYDQALKQGIVQGARRLNIHEAFADPGITLMSSMPFVGAATAVANTLAFGSDVGISAPPKYYVLHVGLISVLNKYGTGKSGLDSRRWSIMPSAFQPDRYARTAARAALTKLITTKS